MSTREQDVVHPRPKTIWIIADGRRGHESQSEGLAQALGMLMPVRVRRIPRLAFGAALMAWLGKKFAPGQGVDAPDLILGAGHGTHLSMLAAQRAWGGRTIVLMKPGLPTHCFDLCLIPEHDGVREKSGILLTQGALNAMVPTARKTPGTGLILVGGPSRHYVWDEVAVLQQINHLTDAEPERAWVVATSPRTPQAMLPVLRTMERQNLALTPFDAVDAAWLPQQLAATGQIWVTPDSVSMLYEALTSGAAVVVFDLPPKPGSRVSAGVAQLVAGQRLLTYAAWRQGKTFTRNPGQFNEAARCARWIKSHWFAEN